jgi:hypothetical protein
MAYATMTDALLRLVGRHDRPRWSGQFGMTSAPIHAHPPPFLQTLSFQKSYFAPLENVLILKGLAQPTEFVVPTARARLSPRGQSAPQRQSHLVQTYINYTVRVKRFTLGGGFGVAILSWCLEEGTGTMTLVAGGRIT